MQWNVVLWRRGTARHDVTGLLTTWPLERLIEVYVWKTALEPSKGARGLEPPISANWGFLTNTNNVTIFS